MFSRACSDFVDVRCRERSGILLRGSDRKKLDRLAANQSARFARIPDRKKIIVCYQAASRLLLFFFGGGRGFRGRGEGGGERGWG